METKNQTIIERVAREMQLQNYSQRSIDTYTAGLHKLQLFSGKSPEYVDIGEFKEFLYHRMSVEKVSTSTLNQAISAYKMLRESVLGLKWEPLKIKRPRRDKKLPVVLSMEEVSKMISLTKNIKHKALIALTYSSGMRRNEIRELLPLAIDSQRMQIHVKQGKGKKDRYTILSQKALDLLRTYYKKYRPAKYLFEPDGRKGVKYGESTLNRIVKNAAKRAGIKKNVTIHTLRHCFATHLLEQGVNIMIIKELMGHTSVKTTSIYLHLANINPMNIDSPLENMVI